MAGFNRVVIAEDPKVGGTFADPAILVRKEGAAFPVDFLQLRGRSSGTTRPVGFFVEIPIQNYTGGNYTLGFDLFPLFQPPAARTVTLLIAATFTAPGATNYITHGYASSFSLGVSVTAANTHYAINSAAITPSLFDGAANGGRMTLIVWRDPTFLTDAYDDAIGIFNMFVAYA